MTATRLPRPFFALIAIPSLVLGLAACSSLDPSAAPKSPSTSTSEWDAAAEKCLADAGYDRDAMSKTEHLSADELASMQSSIQGCFKKVVGKLGERPVSESEKKQSKEYDKKQKEVDACLEANGIDTSLTDMGEGVFRPNFDPTELPEKLKEECNVADVYGSAE